MNATALKSITIKCYHHHRRRPLPHTSILLSISRTLPSSTTTYSFSTDSSSSTSSNSTSIFPWRHETSPLPRLTTLDDLSGQPNNFRGRLIRQLLVSRELDIPWYSVLMGSWKEDLAKDFVWAWKMGIIAVFSKTFGVPMEEITKTQNEEDESLTISFTTPSSTTTTTTTTPLTTSQQESLNTFLSATIDTSLQNLYTPHHNHSSSSSPQKNLQINLHLQPLHYKLQSAFLVPMFTRTHVNQNPNLKGAYTRIEHEFQKTSSPKIVQQMANDLVQNELNGETGYRAIIVDVVVECLEQFWIVDTETDEVLEGKRDEGEREVTHLIRFEMETSSGGGGRGERKLGNWKIIDWDDFLEGNVWH